VAVETTVPRSQHQGLYFILKYEHDLMAALEANAKVHGAGSRAVTRANDVDQAPLTNG